MSPRKRQGIDRRATPGGLSPGAESKVMTVLDVAEYLHCHYSTIYRLVAHQIPAFPLGGSLRFLKSDVDQWIAKGGGKPSGSAPAKTHGGRRGRKSGARG